MSDKRKVWEEFWSWDDDDGSGIWIDGSRMGCFDSFDQEGLRDWTLAKARARLARSAPAMAKMLLDYATRDAEEGHCPQCGSFGGLPFHLDGCILKAELKKAGVIT